MIRAIRDLSPAGKGHAAMLCFSALIAGSFSLGGLIANDIEPAALNAVRFFIAAAVIGALALATGGIPRESIRAPWRYLVLGGLFAFYFVLMFEGLKTAAPVSTAAVFTLTPLMSGLFAWLLMRQVMTPRIALALAIGAAGALWVIFRADWGAFLAFELGRGETIFFIGTISHALFTPMLKVMNRGEASFVYTFWFQAAGCLLLTLWGWGELRATDWASLSWLVWFTVFYLAIFASAGSFLCLQFGARNLPSAKVMAYTYLVPGWVILWEIALGHGAPTALVLVGVGLILVALALLLKDEG